MSTWGDDDALMEELGQAVRAEALVTDRAREAARAAFAWRTIDEELELALGYDSLLEPTALVRSAPGAPARVVSFESPGLSLELEVVPGAVTGQVVPGQVCRIAVESPKAPTVRVDADATGFFTVTLLESGPVRFVVEVEGKRRTSQWLVV